MFGYVVADLGALTPEQLARYRGAYCGLCRCLGERHGALSRLTLNYDMTFLVLLLNAMYEPEETAGTGRCLPHPVHERPWWRSRFTDYAADMNVALAYHSCMDDWHDDRRVLPRAEAELLRAHRETVAAAWPAQCRAVEACMAEIAAVERAESDDPDAAANSFGRLMGTLFTPEPDSFWSGGMRAFGEALGRFIYLMDACVDLERDRRRGSYNPLLRAGWDERSAADRLTLLKMQIGESTAAFERLPIVRDADILRNVLYSGVWTQYEVQRRKNEKRRTSQDERSL